MRAQDCQGCKLELSVSGMCEDIVVRIGYFILGFLYVAPQEFVAYSDDCVVFYDPGNVYGLWEDEAWRLDGWNP